jgi:hypothetical protein
MRLNTGKAADYLRQKLVKGEDKDAIVWGLLKKEHELGIELRRAHEQMWLLSMAYIASKQYTFFNATAHQLQMLLRKPGEKRVVDNQILPKVKRQIADLIKNDPEMSVVPNTTDEEDLKAAKIGDKVLRFWWRNSAMKQLIRRLAVWQYSTGNAFVEDSWNEGIGPVKMDPGSGKLLYEGDVGCVLWSPFELVVPAYGLFNGGLNDLPWVETHTWRTLEALRKFFGKSADKVQAEVRASQASTLAALYGSFGSGQGESELTRGAMLHEFKVQPCTEFPKGLHYYGAGGITLFREDFPFTEYPIQHFKDIEVAGCFWGSSTVEHALQLQNRWNRTLNSIDSFNEIMGKGKWLSPKGAELEVDPNNEHGEILTYKPVLGHMPQHLTVKGLPATYDLILASTRGSLENLFSQHEVTRGTNKSDIRSGDMLEILREQDAHGNIPSHMVFEEALEALARRVLRRIQKGYTTERTIKIPGKDSQWEVLAFKGADLRDNTDVSVRRQSSMPDSRRAREAQIMERFSQGLYGDPRDPGVRREVMNMLKDAVVEDVYADTRLDESVARNENMILMQSETTEIIVNPYDGHRVHLAEHNKHRKSFDYQRVKYENPKLFITWERRFSDHVQQHADFIAEEEKKMLMQQAFLKGGGASA